MPVTGSSTHRQHQRGGSVKKTNQHSKPIVRDLNVEIKTLRNEEVPPTTESRSACQFIIKSHGALTDDAILWLLKLTPIVVVPIPRKKLYQVLFGRRLFELAAFILAPTDTIPVKLIETMPEDLTGKLRYLDTVVLPAIYSLDIPYAELYEHICHDAVHADGAWAIATKAEFARIFDVSRSALSQQGKPRKGSRE